MPGSVASGTTYILFLVRTGENVGIRRHCVCVCVCVRARPFQALNEPTGFHETWYERYAIGGQRKVIHHW